MKILELENEPLAKLRSVAKDLNVTNFNRLKKEALIVQIRQAEAQKEGVELRGGVLEIMSEGIGFLRLGQLSHQRSGCLRLAGAVAALRASLGRPGHRARSTAP